MAVEGSDVPRDRIPVVDFSAMGLQNKDPLKENNQAIKELADQLYQAFSKIGFVYLKKPRDSTGNGKMSFGDAWFLQISSYFRWRLPFNQFSKWRIL